MLHTQLRWVSHEARTLPNPRDSNEGLAAYDPESGNVNEVGCRKRGQIGKSVKPNKRLNSVWNTHVISSLETNGNKPGTKPGLLFPLLETRNTQPPTNPAQTEQYHGRILHAVLQATSVDLGRPPAQSSGMGGVVLCPKAAARGVSFGLFKFGNLEIEKLSWFVFPIST